MSKRWWDKVRPLRPGTARTARGSDGRPVAVATATAVVACSLAVGALLPPAAFDALTGHRPASSASASAASATSPGPATTLRSSPWRP